MFLGVKNIRSTQSEETLIAQHTAQSHAFDGLAFNFYGGRKETDGPMDAIQQLFQLGERLHLPIFISETGSWALDAQDLRATHYRDQLLPYLNNAHNLVGVTWFEPTDEQRKKSGSDPNLNDFPESHYGILGKKLRLFGGGDTEQR